MEKIRVLLKKDSPNSGFGYYNRGDKGYVIDFSQSNAIILLDNGKFARADINSIECIEETEEISGNNVGISSNYELTKFVEEILAAIQDFDINKKDGFTDIESARKHAIRILNAAKRQLQPEIDKALNQARANGKAEALKDMPKWRKYKTEWDSVTEHLYKGYYIDLEELFYKLPKEE